MAFQLIYHPDVKTEDIPILNAKLKKRIKSAIENRLAIAPHKYGSPLGKTLKGYWKLRVGDYRVIYKVTNKEVLILGIIHRKNVYKKIDKRAY